MALPWRNRFQVSIPRRLTDQAAPRARRTRRTVSRLVRDLLLEWLEREVRWEQGRDSEELEGLQRLRASRPGRPPREKRPRKPRG